MAEDTTASIIQLRKSKRPKTPAERARAYRERIKAAKAAQPVAPVQPPAAAVQPTQPVQPASVALTVAAIGLAGVGLVMNGWFARTLGSTDIAGWLFLAIGVASDLAALAVPSSAARLWRTHQRGAAVAGWLVWLATFIFAVTAGVGFASTNITAVTMERSSRVTPAVSGAQAALADATLARDRECKGGVGKFCREREATVVERQQALSAAMHTVEEAADPQTEAARHVVTWLSLGLLHPTGDDFAMLRLVLLAMLPQIGGVLLMLARAS
jgi:hypothetical protein